MVGEVMKLNSCDRIQHQINRLLCNRFNGCRASLTQLQGLEMELDDHLYIKCLIARHCKSETAIGMFIKP